MGEYGHGPAVREGAGGRAVGGRCAARALADDYLRSRPAAGRADRPDGDRWGGQRGPVRGLRRTDAGAHPSAWGCGSHGQPVLPQAGAGACVDRDSRVYGSVSAAVQPGPQPDRVGLRQAQGVAAEGGPADGGRAVGFPGRGAGGLQPGRVSQLLPPLRLSRYTNLESALEQGRRATVRTTNAILTATYWEVGRQIVEFEQGGEARAEYGEELLKRLGQDLTAKYGRGFGWRNLFSMRNFYLSWAIFQMPSGKVQARAKCPMVSGESSDEKLQ